MNSLTVVVISSGWKPACALVKTVCPFQSFVQTICQILQTEKEDNRLLIVQGVHGGTTSINDGINSAIYHGLYAVLLSFLTSVLGVQCVDLFSSSKHSLACHPMNFQNHGMPQILTAKSQELFKIYLSLFVM